MSYKKLLLLFCLSIFLSYGREANAQTPQTFNYTGSTVQWTVPTCVSQVTVDVRGAQGGTNGAYTGGLGARMQGILAVTPSEVLTIYVGGQGGATYESGSGGGGSGITNGATPLVIAGGGGGASLIESYNGMPGLTTTAGGSSSGPGGTGGLGGDKGYYSGDCGWSAGGGGFSGDGYGGPSGDGGALPGTLSGPGAGKAALNGGAGGTDNGCNGTGAAGGWGCGGGGSGNYGGGGGGGYSGGGGGQYRVAATSPGGGGGSYSVASSQTNTQGYQSGNGQVVITYLGGGSLSNIAQVISNVSCFGANNGVASAKVTGSSTPYTYLWAPSGGNKDTAGGLSPGTYTITVHDPCGNSVSSSVIITQPNLLTVSASPLGNVSCNGGNNGTASSTVNGGTGPFTYSWTPAGGSGATGVGLSVGTYSLNVKDNHGCTGSATVTITQPAALSITATTTANIPCYGDNNGITLGTAHSGTPPYNYVWTPSGGNLATAVGLAPGIYTVTLTDNNGCTGSARTTVTQPAATLTTAVTVVNNILCYGLKTGNISSSTAGGTLPYTYSWTGGQSNATASSLTAGSYTLNITDAHGCTVAAAATVTQPTAVKVITNFTVDSGHCTGSAWVMVNGGVIPYTYLWSNGNTTDYIYGVCGTTKYCCTVTDAQGCSIDSDCVVVNNVLGVGSVIANSGKVMVYPNPTSGQFTIQLSGMSRQWSVEVYNVLGEKVYSQSNIQNAISNINLSNQPNGVYLYRIVSAANGNTMGQGKIVLDK